MTTQRQSAMIAVDREAQVSLFFILRVILMDEKDLIESFYCGIFSNLLIISKWVLGGG